MTLLDQINGLNDVSFTTKDVIYLIGFVVTILSAYFKMQLDKEKMNAKLATLETVATETTSRLKEESLSAKNGRHALRKELTENVERKEKDLHEKIEKVESDSNKNYLKLEKQIEELRKEQSNHTQQIIQAIKEKK